MIALMMKENFTTVRDRFRAEKFALNLGERDSTATITVGPEAPEIIIGDILRDEDEPGAGIVWRVSKVDTDYKTGTVTLSCSHVISLLKEKLLFGEQTTATICGRTGATKCTAKEAMRYVMSFQRDFELGDFPTGYEGVSNAYSFNGDDLFSAMETISDTLEDCWWEYDLRKYPFKLHLRDRRQAKVETELRLTRNIQNAKLTVDRSGMYTRLFPVGKGDLQLTEKSVGRNEQLYGMICKTESNAEKETEEALREWAKNQLKLHAEPSVTVTVTAQDLSQQTGEPMDHIMLGAVCQMPLREYGTTILERINKMSWSDKIADPNSITVTMANTRSTVSTIVASAIKSSAKSSRVSSTVTSKGVQDIDLTTDKKDKNKYILWRQDYKGVWKDIATFSRAVASWTVSVTDGTIKVTAHPQEQSKSVKIRDGGGEWSGKTFTGVIEYSADNGENWSLTGLEYTADGEGLYNSGWRAAAGKVELATTQATNVNSILIKTPPSTVDGAAVSTSYILSSYNSNTVDLETLVNGSYVTVARLTHGNYTSGYNSGWGAAAGKVDLPKTETTNINSILIKTPPSTVDGAAESTSYILSSYDNNHVDLETMVGGDYVTVARLTHGKYNAGWQAAAGKVDLPKTQVTNINSILIKTPPSTVDGAAESTSYIMSNYDDNHVDLETLVGSNYVTVARITHGKYNAGWQAAAAYMTPPTPQTTNAYMDVWGPGSTPGSWTDYRFTLTLGNNYAKILDGNGDTVAQLAQFYNTSGTLYYDSYEFKNSQFTYYYHQTISQQSQAIVSRGSRVVYWHT